MVEVISKSSIRHYGVVPPGTFRVFQGIEPEVKYFQRVSKVYTEQWGDVWIVTLGNSDKPLLPGIYFLTKAWKSGARGLLELKHSLRQVIAEARQFELADETHDALVASIAEHPESLQFEEDISMFESKPDGSTAYAW